MIKLHDVPVTIVSDRDVKFASYFWKTLWTNMGMKLMFSSAFHPQTDGQTEVTTRAWEIYYVASLQIMSPAGTSLFHRQIMSPTILLTNP